MFYKSVNLLLRYHQHRENKMKWIKPFYATAFLLISAPSFAAFTCIEAEDLDIAYDQYPTEDVEGVIPSSTLLFEKGVHKCFVRFDRKGRKSNHRSIVETGLHDGILYRVYYSDGSGTIQGDKDSSLNVIHDLNLSNWSLKCEIDGMDDSHWCALTKNDFRIGLDKHRKTFVWIGGAHYPHTDMTIRIDKNKPISAPENKGFSMAQSELIHNQLMKADSALTRYQKWPYQKNIDAALTPYGFEQAWKILNAVYNSIEP